MQFEHIFAFLSINNTMKNVAARLLIKIQPILKTLFISMLFELKKIIES